MKLFKITAISIGMLFLFCNAAAMAATIKRQVQATPKAPVSSQTSPTKQTMPTAGPKPNAVSIQQPSKIIIPDVSIGRPGGTVICTLVDPKGKRLSGKKIRFCFNCTASAAKTSPFYPTPTDALGNIKHEIRKPSLEFPYFDAGTYKLHAYFDGDETAPPGFGSCTVTILKSPTKIDNLCVYTSESGFVEGIGYVESTCYNELYMGEKYKIKGEIWEMGNLRLRGCGGLQVSVNGNAIGWALMETGNGAGNIFHLLNWTVPVTLIPGNLTFTVRFPGDKNHLPSSASIKCKTLPRKKP